MNSAHKPPGENRPFYDGPTVPPATATPAGPQVVPATIVRPRRVPMRPPDGASLTAAVQSSSASGLGEGRGGSGTGGSGRGDGGNRGAASSDGGDRGGGEQRQTYLRPGEEIGERLQYVPRRGKHIGRRFRIEEKLGEGTYGQVYRASDRSISCYGDPPYLQVAVKVVRRRDGMPIGDEEVHSLASINHSNVVKVSAWFYLNRADVLDGALCIVMSLVNGKSLQAELGRYKTPVSLAWLKAAVRQIAAGTAAVHAIGLVHRDLKLGNFQVDASDHSLKLVDFGVSRLLSRSTAPGQADSREHARDELAGTPGYIPPEMWAQGLNVKLPIAYRQDLFALGVIFYQMIVGASAHPLGLEAAYQLPGKSDEGGADGLHELPTVSKCSSAQALFAARVKACAYVPIPKASMPDEWLRKRFDQLLLRLLDVPLCKGAAASKTSFQSATELRQALTDLFDEHDRRRSRQHATRVGKVAAMVLVLATGGAWLYQYRGLWVDACDSAKGLQNKRPSPERLKDGLHELIKYMSKGLKASRLALGLLAESLWLGSPDTPDRMGGRIADVLAHSQAHGRSLILREGRQQAELWDSKDWRPIPLDFSSFSTAGDPSPALSVIGAIFVPQRQWLITWHNREPDNQRVARWDSETGKFDRWLAQGPRKGRDSAAKMGPTSLGESVEQVVASADGTWLFARTAAKRVWAWNESTGFERLPQADGWVLSMALSTATDGSVLVLAGKQGQVLRWKLGSSGSLAHPRESCTLTPQIAHELKSQDRPPLPDLVHIVFDAKGERMALASRGWNTWVLPVREATCDAVQLSACPQAATERNPLGCPKVSSLSFLPNRQELLVGDSDGHIAHWDVDAKPPRRTLLSEKHASRVDDLAVLLGGGLVVSTSGDGVRVWDATDLKPVWMRAKPEPGTSSSREGQRVRLFPRNVEPGDSAVFVHFAEGWLRLDAGQPSAAQPAGNPACDLVALLRATYVDSNHADMDMRYQSTEMDTNAKACSILACQKVHERDGEASACQDAIEKVSPSSWGIVPFGCSCSVGGRL